jgi:hypothetical protein
MILCELVIYDFSLPYNISHVFGMYTHNSYNMCVSCDLRHGHRSSSPACGN